MRFAFCCVSFGNIVANKVAKRLANKVANKNG